mmetsp:Transcript_50/g.120  ORF Transcript_50/g.120 Transcript_50/m.120 type:complete len:148 (-) Transcript_50:15-458(-)
MDRSARRLMKELASLRSHPISNMEIHESDSWGRLLVTIRGAEQTLYAGESFRLQFVFSSDYPMDPPEVIFLDPPIHPHIYSNGHICLNILGSGWTPALSVESVCLSLLSMLSSCQSKTRPPDDDQYCRNSLGRSPKETRWWFHDDAV